jgi:hypothetical protein
LVTDFKIRSLQNSIIKKDNKHSSFFAKASVTDVENFTNLLPVSLLKNVLSLKHLPMTNKPFVCKAKAQPFRYSHIGKAFKAQKTRLKRLATSKHSNLCVYVNQGDEIGRNFTFWATFQRPGKFWGEMWFVVGIFRVSKGFDVDVLDFQIEL